MHPSPPKLITVLFEDGSTKVYDFQDRSLTLVLLGRTEGILMGETEDLLPLLQGAILGLQMREEANIRKESGN